MILFSRYVMIMTNESLKWQQKNLDIRKQYGEVPE